MRALSTEWARHLDGQDKQNFEDLVRNTVTVLSRLRAILEDKEASVYKTEASESEYDNPAWAYKQAHLNGKLAAYRELKTLTNFLDQIRKP
jgi:hypothetical protein